MNFTGVHLYPNEIFHSPLPVRKHLKSSFHPGTKNNMSEKYWKFQNKYRNGNILATTLICLRCKCIPYLWTRVNNEHINLLVLFIYEWICPCRVWDIKCRIFKYLAYLQHYQKLATLSSTLFTWKPQIMLATCSQYRVVIDTLNQYIFLHKLECHGLGNDG